MNYLQAFITFGNAVRNKRKNFSPPRTQIQTKRMRYIRKRLARDDADRRGALARVSRALSLALSCGVASGGRVPPTIRDR